MDHFGGVRPSGEVRKSLLACKYGTDRFSLVNTNASSSTVEAPSATTAPSLHELDDVGSALKIMHSRCYVPASDPQKTDSESKERQALEEERERQELEEERERQALEEEREHLALEEEREKGLKKSKDWR